MKLKLATRIDIKDHIIVVDNVTIDSKGIKYGTHMYSAKYNTYHDNIYYSDDYFKLLAKAGVEIEYEEIDFEFYIGDTCYFCDSGNSNYEILSSKIKLLFINRAGEESGECNYTQPTMYWLEDDTRLKYNYVFKSKKLCLENALKNKLSKI